MHSQFKLGSRHPSIVEIANTGEWEGQFQITNINHNFDPDSKFRLKIFRKIIQELNKSSQEQNFTNKLL